MDLARPAKDIHGDVRLHGIYGITIQRPRVVNMLDDDGPIVLLGLSFACSVDNITVWLFPCVEPHRVTVAGLFVPLAI